MFSSVVAVLQGSVASVAVVLCLGVLFSVVYISNKQFTSNKNAKKIKQLEAEVSKLSKEVASVNSKLSLIMPDSKRIRG